MPFGSSQWMYSSGFYPTVIDQSLRFDGSSSYLSRTPSVAGDRRTWTWSSWVKRSDLASASVPLLSAYSDGSNFDLFRFDNGSLRFYTVVSGVDYSQETPAVFRDPSAWYHVVFSVDTTQATAANRFRIYVNGVQQTTTQYYGQVPQNYDCYVNSTYAHNIGRNIDAPAQIFDGYLADTYFVDGTALDPTSFGEFKNGVWIPKAYTGSYGTNGFHLEYSDNANDSSGTGNNWTATNIVAGDYMLDSPTNNYATLNPLLPASSPAATLSNGNLTASVSPSLANAVSSMGMSSGKFYWEFTWTYTGSGIFVGIDSNLAFSGQQAAGSLSTGYGYYNADGTKKNAGSAAYGSSWYSSGTYVIGVAFDATNGTLTYYLDNVSQGTAFAGIPAGTYYASMCFVSGSGSTTCHFNFGQSGFTYTPPDGFLALSAANLPEPSISPLYGASPQDHFNTVLYTGNSSTQTISTVNFQPDLLWIKVRNTAGSHDLFDSVRGANKVLYSNVTAAEETVTAGTGVTAFNSNGFALGDNTAGVTYGETNFSGNTYVAWNWKASNATAVSNTEGTITSQVSANPTAGFSIVSYIGTGAAATVGHGLGVKPSMIILKNRSGAYDWPTWSQYLPNPTIQHFWLNQTNAAQTSGSFNSTQPTSSVFSIGTTGEANGNTNNLVAYCFHDVEGYSKFGSYTGNGSTDGTFVYTGFRPAYVMVKRYTDIGNWQMFDSSRDLYNPEDGRLYANLSDSENDAASIDFVSNGFKLRATSGDNNSSGHSYIYMAFAENPFKYANAR
jgi:hypothetical protein